MCLVLIRNKIYLLLLGRQGMLRFCLMCPEFPNDFSTATADREREGKQLVCSKSAEIAVLH
jgi:hypothetical protein